jgi:hypothetical protein
MTKLNFNSFPIGVYAHKSCTSFTLEVKVHRIFIACQSDMKSLKSTRAYILVPCRNYSQYTELNIGTIQLWYKTNDEQGA